MRSFRFLVAAPGRPDSEVLERNYAPQDLGRAVIVRDEAARCFLCFADLAEFWAWYGTEPHETAYHEVVPGRRPQHLKFDLDIPAASLAEPDSADCQDPALAELGLPPATAESRAEAILQRLIETALTVFCETYLAEDEAVLSRDDVLVADSCGPAKYSYHVLLKGYTVATADEAREFTRRVVERLPEADRRYVDTAVNSRRQNFRLILSSKDGRTKRCRPELARRLGTACRPPAEHLVMDREGRAQLLTTRLAAGETEAPPDPALGSETLQRVLALAQRQGALEGHRFLRAAGRLLLFQRTAPSHCRLCDRRHDSDNTLMLSVQFREACPVVEHCRHAPGRSRALGELGFSPAVLADLAGQTASAGAADQLRESTLQRHIRAARTEPATARADSRSAFEELPPARQTVYSEPQMAPYELVPTLAVRAQMKLGKTRELRRYLDRNFPPSELRPPVIRIVTFRQTFSNSLQEQFPDFVLYSSFSGPITTEAHPRCIVQVESLHRLAVTAPPVPADLLVLDEVESVLAQFNSGLHQNFAGSFAAFQLLLQSSRHVVAMDANLSDRTYRTLLRMRPEHPPHFHWNRHSRAQDDRYHFTTDYGLWLDLLLQAVEAGRRLVVPMNSLAEAERLEALLRRSYPQKRVRLYSSKSLPAEKAAHFRDVHRHWGELDVLLYTPTVSAGVSYEQAHFDMLFGYFSDQSCDVETCRQMLGRVRNIGRRHHVICLRGSSRSLPTEPEAIQAALVRRRATLFEPLAGAVPSYSYDPATGEVYYYRSPYFYLWLENVRMANLSRNHFVRRFVNQVCESGARVAHLAPPAGERPERITQAKAALHTAGEQVAQEEAAAIHAAPEISPEEYERIRSALRGGDLDAPLTRADVAAYERHRLEETYSRPVPDAGYVLLYKPPAARRVYQNLKRIAEGPSVQASLERIQAGERAFHVYATENGDDLSEHRDLTRRYVFPAHRLAVLALLWCGFRCLLDPALLPLEFICRSLQNSQSAIVQALPDLYREFEIQAPSLERLRPPDVPVIAEQILYVTRLLRPLNTVLRKMYGREVGRIAPDNYYRLDWTPTGRLFRVGDPELPDDGRPVVPSALQPVEEPPAMEFLRTAPPLREPD